MDLRRIGTLACVAVVLLVIVAGTCYGLYVVTLKSIGHELAVAWALVSTALLPVAMYAAFWAGKTGYRLGKMRSDDVIAGIGLGSGPVVQTAQQVADIKVQTARRLRQPEPVQTVEVQLPVFEAVPRRLPSGRDVVDL